MTDVCSIQREQALVALGNALRERRYEFVTVTPATHARVRSRRPLRAAATLRDVFGWSMPFASTILDREVIECLAAGGALYETPEGLRSAVRASTLEGELFFHSAFPTTEPDAVFFGPDTYRFCSAIGRAHLAPARVLDIGCGSGAGGIIAGRRAARVVLADVNAKALGFARVNAILAGNPSAEIVESDVVAAVTGDFDLIVANPPYMRDDAGRRYRDGGGDFGEALSLRMLSEGLRRLAPGGTLLLYTGAPVVAGRDVFFAAARGLLERSRVPFRYEEIDPDVFGEELEKPGYAAVERIAAVVLTAARSNE
jgi:release factor glutamine methyltransferase